MHVWLKTLVLASSLLFAGCGGGVKEETTEVVQLDPADIVKAIVGGIATSGAELGSGEESLREAIEELRKKDAGKVKSLESDLEKLIKARDPSSRKAAAKAMVSKL